MEYKFILGSLLLLSIGTTHAFYNNNDDVIVLTPSNFDRLVIESDELWIVEFYAPWCGHCKNLTPEWKKAAEALKGVANVGAVDADEHKSLGGKYGVRGFPTIKVFGANKNAPEDYQGGRSSDDIVDSAMKALRKMVSDKKSGGGKQSRGGGQGGSGGGDSGTNEVVTLTDDNFRKLVLESKESWLVEFYAPWCGHCKNLEPHWKAAASELKDKTGGAVKLGALDATMHQATAQKYGVQGYPTIKVFRQGFKDEDPQDYQGGRTTNDIVNEAMTLYNENKEPPSLDEITSQDVLKEACDSKQLCILTFIPNILDSMAEGRNKDLDLLRQLGEKFKNQNWGWLWAEGEKQSALEEALNIGGYGYPAVAAVNVRKEMYTVCTHAFSQEGMTSFLNGLSFGRAGRQTHSLKGGKMPEIETTEPWNGEDGELPQGDDYDLSDFSWDEDDDAQKDEL